MRREIYIQSSGCLKLFHLILNVILMITSKYFSFCYSPSDLWHCFELTISNSMEKLQQKYTFKIDYFKIFRLTSYCTVFLSIFSSISKSFLHCSIQLYISWQRRKKDEKKKKMVVGYVHCHYLRLPPFTSEQLYLFTTIYQQTNKQDRKITITLICSSEK